MVDDDDDDGSGRGDGPHGADDVAPDTVASDAVAPDAVDAIVAQWARERPELDTAPMAIFGRVFRIGRVAGDAATAAYARHGITRGDFDVLASLRRAGEPFALSPTQLTATLMLTSGGVTGRVDRLEAAGLVRRSPDPDDRRALVVSLTPEGRRLVDEAVTAGLEAQHALVAGLPPERRALLADLLRDLLASSEAGLSRLPRP